MTNSKQLKDYQKYKKEVVLSVRITKKQHDFVKDNHVNYSELFRDTINDLIKSI